MKKNILAVFTLLCTVISLAQSPSEKTLLWEISGKGVKKPSYLFGTIHLMCASEIKIPVPVKSKFNLCSQVYMELKTDDPGMMKNIMELMKMKDSTSLKKLIGVQYDSANEQFTKLTSMSLDLMNTTKPVLVMSAIYPALLGCMPASWEKIFETEAKKEKKEIKGLESIQDQLSIFDTIPYQLQADMLAKVIMNIDSARQELNKMLAVYRKKDINELNKLTLIEDDFKKYEDQLLTNRNRNWINIIAAEIKKRQTFFAFGAGHLGGDNGVVSMLRKAGYRVKAVMY